MYGGTEITIEGSGFRGEKRSYPSRIPGNKDLTIEQSAVTVGGQPCQIMFANTSLIRCITPSLASPGVKQIKIDALIESSFEMVTEETPVIESVAPLQGVEGQTLVIDGTFPASRGGSTVIKVGGAVCIITAQSSDQISCTLGSHPAGNVTIVVNIAGVGDSNRDKLFTYQLTGTVSNAPVRSFPNFNLL